VVSQESMFLMNLEPGILRIKGKWGDQSDKSARCCSPWLLMGLGPFVPRQNIHIHPRTHKTNPPVGCTATHSPSWNKTLSQMINKRVTNTKVNNPPQLSRAMASGGWARLRAHQGESIMVTYASVPEAATLRRPSLLAAHWVLEQNGRIYSHN
jgi:hypothetical protein